MRTVCVCPNVNTCHWSDSHNSLLLDGEFYTKHVWVHFLELLSSTKVYARLKNIQLHLSPFVISVKHRQDILKAEGFTLAIVTGFPSGLKALLLEGLVVVYHTGMNRVEQRCSAQIQLGRRGQHRNFKGDPSKLLPPAKLL